MKKILSIVLAIAVMMTVVSTMAFAADVFTETSDVINMTGWASAGNDSLKANWPIASVDGEKTVYYMTSKTSSAASSDRPSFRIEPVNGDNYTFGADAVYMYTTFTITSNLSNVSYIVCPDYSMEYYTGAMNAGASVEVKIFKDVKNNKVWVKGLETGNPNKIGEQTTSRNGRAADLVAVKIGSPQNVSGSAESPVTVVTISNFNAAVYEKSDANATFADFVNFIENPAGGDEPDEPADTPQTDVEFEKYNDTYNGTATYLGDGVYGLSSTNASYFGIRMTPTKLYGTNAQGWLTDARYVSLSADFEELATLSGTVFYGKGTFESLAQSAFGTISNIKNYGPNGANATKYNLKCIVDTKTSDTYYYVDNVLVGFVKGSEYKRSLGFAFTGAYSNAPTDGYLLKISNIEVNEYDVGDDMGVYNAYIEGGVIKRNLVLSVKDLRPTTNSLQQINTTVYYTACYDANDMLISAHANGGEFTTTGVKTKVYLWDSSTLQPYTFATGLLVK